MGGLKIEICRHLMTLMRSLVHKHEDLHGIPSIQINREGQQRSMLYNPGTEEAGRAGSLGLLVSQSSWVSEVKTFSLKRWECNGGRYLPSISGLHAEEYTCACIPVHTHMHMHTRVYTCTHIYTNKQNKNRNLSFHIFEYQKSKIKVPLKLICHEGPFLAYR